MVFLQLCASGLDQKVDRFEETLSSRIDGTNTRIDNLEAQLNTRIDVLDTKFSWYVLWPTTVFCAAYVSST